MRNPNGYGAVYKLSGKRRNPYIARKTIGWSDEGKQLYHTIGYFKDRREALQALADFNKNPYSIESSTVTFSELFDKWKVIKFEQVSKSAINGYNAAFDTAKNLHDMKFVDIKTTHMQEVIRNSGKGYDTLRKLKVLFNQLFKFAMENDIVSKDYSDYIDIGKRTTESSRVAFTEDEIKRLFEVVDHIEYVDTILIMIYTGLRIGELLLIKNSDIDLVNRTITGGIKTEAGKDRIVPISNKIYNLIKNRMSKENKYFIQNAKDGKMKYDNYYKDRFIPIMDALGFKHKPHDCRHTFATLMGNAGADTVALQKIIGHANYATTAAIYTHKDIEQLRKAIDLI